MQREFGGRLIDVAGAATGWLGVRPLHAQDSLSATRRCQPSRTRVPLMWQAMKPTLSVFTRGSA